MNKHQVFLNSVLAAILALVFAVTPVCANNSGSFALHVDDVSGIDEPWPLLGGLPFPEGALNDASQIRIVNDNGAEMPAQIDVVATWRDGSIRWAHVGFTATPQGEYEVQFGPGVSRMEPTRALRVEEHGAGYLTVDTGPGIYEFAADALLPTRATVDGVEVLEDAGDGAYLIDNHGRVSRVSGTAAEITSEIFKQGPTRTVLRREGWYVTATGERVARARMWFYFSVESPFVRMTHSLVLTEDTNQLWVRDYGLKFKTSRAPSEAVFSLSESVPAETFPPTSGNIDESIAVYPKQLAHMFSLGLYERNQTLLPFALEGADEVYMLQDDYPHVGQRNFRGVIARASAALEGGGIGNLWDHEWLETMDVAGDWGEARYENHSLMVVMPQLAQRFPKEIAFGPNAARVAFWSGRSGRELDFRAATLVDEYWRDWAENAEDSSALPDHIQDGPQAANAVAQFPSNAQSAARTHDIWLLPRTRAQAAEDLIARSKAAAHPPVLKPDPAWLTATDAIGWSMHPVDRDRFRAVEDKLERYWELILGGVLNNAGVRPTGYIMWGKNVGLGRYSRWFRLSGAIDYSLRNHAWYLYLRGGGRHYYDYGRHNNRFIGDLGLHHWTAGDKFKGGWAGFTDRDFKDLPFYWGDYSRFSTNASLHSWPLEYYLTGDEYAHELIQMVGDAYKDIYDRGQHLGGSETHGHLHNLAMLHELEWDETYNDTARFVANRLIDLDNPTGLNDIAGRGVYYKTSKQWVYPLFSYYRATGDEDAREAILKAMDDKFRFNHVLDRTNLPGSRGPVGDQHYGTFLWSLAYQWTGNPAYLSVIRYMVEELPDDFSGTHLPGQTNVFMGVPKAMQILAETDQPIAPFPVLSVTRDGDVDLEGDYLPIEADEMPPLILTKDADEAARLSIYFRLSNEVVFRDCFCEDSEPVVEVVGPAGGPVEGVEIETEQMFATRNESRRDLRRWHFFVTLPAASPAGEYTIRFPNAGTLTVLESNVQQLVLGAF